MLFDGAANDTFAAGVLSLDLGDAGGVVDTIDVVSIIGDTYFIDGVARPGVTTANVRRIVTKQGNQNNDTVRFEGGVPFNLPDGLLIGTTIEFTDIRTEIRGVTANAIEITTNANAGGVNLGADLRTVGRNVTIARAITLTGDVQIVTDDPGGANNAGAITLSRNVDGFRNFTLDARSDTGASGTITIGTVGGQGQIGDVTPLASFKAFTAGTLDVRVPIRLTTDGGNVELTAGTLLTNTGLGIVPYVINTEVGDNNNAGNVTLNIGTITETSPPGVLQVDVRTGAGNTSGLVTLPTGFAKTGTAGAFDVYTKVGLNYQIQVAPTGAGFLLNENFNGPTFSPQIVPQAGSTFTHANNEYRALRSPNANTIATFNLGALPATGVTVQTNVRVGPTSGTGNNRTFSNGFVVFNYVNPLNFMVTGIEAANDLLVIGQVVNGVYSRLSSRKVRFDPGVTYTLRAVITATNVTVTANGLNALTRAVANPLAGRVGIGTINAESVFDNITVTS